MAIIQEVNLYQFRDAFVRADRRESFSYEGLEHLFNYMEEQSETCGTNYILDVVELCCEYTESSYDQIAADYDIDLSDCEDEEEKLEGVLQYLEENTAVVAEFNGTFIYQQF